jgi:hypothetical protein
MRRPALVHKIRGAFTGLPTLSALACARFDHAVFDEEA